VRVIVAAFENPNAIRIPQQAVQELQGLKSVYVVGAEDKAEARQIVAKYRIGNDWVVDNGLNAGDRIVVEGVSKVRSGAPVKPVAASAVTHNSAADHKSGSLLGELRTQCDAARESAGTHANVESSRRSTLGCARRFGGRKRRARI
jgi:hypothetical protein